jgi:hypothetical protein
MGCNGSLSTAPGRNVKAMAWGPASMRATPTRRQVCFREALQGLRRLLGAALVPGHTDQPAGTGLPRPRDQPHRMEAQGRSQNEVDPPDTLRKGGGGVHAVLSG